MQSLLIQTLLASFWISSFLSWDTNSLLVLAFSSSTSVSSASQKSKYEALLTWLKEDKKAPSIHPSIYIDESSLLGGYGAFVADEIDQDTLLFTIPRGACITLSDALQDPECGEAFQRIIQKAGPGGNTVVMAAYVAKQWLQTQQHYEIAENKNLPESSSSAVPPSSFGPYLSLLPWARGTNNQEHILYWSDEEIESLLKGSMCYAEAKGLREEVNLATTVMEQIISNAIRELRGDNIQGGFRWPWEAKTEVNKEPIEGLSQAMNGAFVSLLTRAFQDGEGDDEKLVPLLDMLQHSDEPNISHSMRTEDGSVEVRARRKLSPGEELLNQYRSELEETMPYHRFFTRFGFVPGIMEPIQNLLEDKSSIFYPQKAEV